MDMQGFADPSRCALQSRIFAAVGDVVFRRAEGDGTPVMWLSLGAEQAAVPLRKVQREFGISDTSPDGRMLGLIAESLEYVAALRIGDALPCEVLTGEASWQPPPQYREVAASRLRLQLVAWSDPSAAGGDPRDRAALQQLASDARLPKRLQTAYDVAAKALPVASASVVAGLLDELAADLAYIEALRVTLLRRVQAVAVRLDDLSRGSVADPDWATVLAATRRLAGKALLQIAGRFIDVDRRTNDIIATLRDVSDLRPFLRSARDWLYRTGRAWEPILTEWENADLTLDEAAWHRIGRTFQFVAPRHMSVQEWLEQAREQRVRELERAMVW